MPAGARVTGGAAARDLDPLAGLERIPGLHAVPRGEDGDVHAIAARDGIERVAVANDQHVWAVATHAAIDTRRREHHLCGELRIRGYPQVLAHREAPFGQVVQLTDD